MQRVASVGGEGIELCQRTIYKGMYAAVDADGMPKRIADLCVGDAADAVVELQAVPADVVQDAAIQCDGRFRGIGV